MNNQNETIAICGLGYVGYPVAMLFADAGFNVIGVDILEERVQRLNEGENPIKGQEPGLDELVEKVIKKVILEQLRMLKSIVRLTSL